MTLWNLRANGVEFLSKTITGNCRYWMIGGIVRYEHETSFNVSSRICAIRRMLPAELAKCRMP